MWAFKILSKVKQLRFSRRPAGMNQMNRIIISNRIVITAVRFAQAVLIHSEMANAQHFA
jgi:hypothetical protein